MLRILYITSLGIVFGLCYEFLPLGGEMGIYALGTFTGIMIGTYLLDFKKFLLVDLIFFGFWFLISFDFWVIPFFFIFLGTQLLFRTLINMATYHEKRVVILGDGELEENVRRSLKDREGYYFSDTGKIELLIIAKLKPSHDEIREILQMKLSGVQVKGYLEYMLEYEKKIEVSYIDEEWLLNAYGFDILRSRLQNKIKRVFDLAMAITIGILTLPIMLISAVIVKFESPGGVIYSQSRVGEKNIEFMVHKFRSMRADAEKGGAQWAQVNDPRVTKYGNFMRKTRIDELPQLWNVLKGEMSFIGPRPERMVFIKELEKQIPYYGLRHMVKPGLTGWAQVMYPYGATVEDAKNKLEYDLYYIKAYSLYLDIVILFKTLKTVVFGRGR